MQSHGDRAGEKNLETVTASGTGIKEIMKKKVYKNTYTCTCIGMKKYTQVHRSPGILRRSVGRSVGAAGWREARIVRGGGRGCEGGGLNLQHLISAK